MTIEPARLILAGDGDALRRVLAERLDRHSAVESCRVIEGWEVEAGEVSDLGARTAAFLPRRGPLPRGEAERVGTAAGRWAAAGLGHLILVSSARVHEPSHRHPGLLSEERLRLSHPANTVARRWLEMERAVVAALAGSSTPLTILRPAALPLPGGDDLFSRLLAGSWALVPPGFNPPLQFLHPEDLAEAILRAATARRGGIFHLAPAAVVPLRRAVALGGQHRLPLAFSAGDELAYLRYPWTICGGKSRGELGFEPRHDSAGAVLALRRAGAPRTDPEPDHDPFGMDREYIRRLGRTLFRFLHDVYWRVEWRGLEHVPRRGRVVLTGVHRGYQPWDGVMALHLLARELGRFPRFLIHPALVKFPFLAPYMSQCGGVPACRENAAWVLRRDEILGVFPEGIRGAFVRYRDAYRLQSFGRHDYVRFALRHRAPIVPFVTLGSAEIFPILGKLHWRWWRRFSEWPCLPVTPTLGLVPLPSKWHTLFLPPLPVHERYPPEAADDGRLVVRLGEEVRQRMQATLDDLRARRRWIFWGSIFDEPSEVMA